MNIYIRELKAHLKSLSIWSSSMIVFILMGMQKYDALLGDGNTKEFMEMMKGLPKSLQAIFGMNSLDITTPLGYFAILFFYIALLLAIHSGMLGQSIISKEEKEKTAEFLMVKPVTRSRIMNFKLLAALTNIAILNLVVFITSYFYISNLASDSVVVMFLIFIISMFLIQFFFLIIGFSLGTMFKKFKKASLYTTVIILFTFFLSIIIDISSNLEFLNFLSPFKYFDPKKTMISKNINIIYVLLIFVISSILLYKGYKTYNKRDLSI